MAWPLLGSCGAFCLDAHQTTAASAISDKKSCMSAKRRFMTGTGTRAGSHGGGEGLVQQAAGPGQPAEVPDGSRRCRYPEPPPVRSMPMPAPLRALPLAFALALSPGAPAVAQGPPPAPKLVVQKPERKVLIREGQSGRMLLGGRWYFRLDDAFEGEARRFYAQPSLDGWTAITVPNAWNATDTTQNRSSVGWYRKEFTLPSAPKGHRYGWKARFQSANQRAVVWLNGKKVGGNDRGYLPFEVDLKGLRRGRNTLVVKVSSLRSATDLTHWRPAAFNGYGSGGWWNFGGLLREVYVRPVEGVDIENVLALPRLARLRGPARVVVKVRARNLTRRNHKVDFALNVSGPGTRQRVVPRSQGVGGGGTRDLRFSFTIPRPRLWQPGRAA